MSPLDLLSDVQIELNETQSFASFISLTIATGDILTRWAKKAVSSEVEMVVRVFKSLYAAITT